MKIFIIILIILYLISCNPFAPKLDESLSGNNFFGDQTEVEGLFVNWSLAYNFRDTLIYQRILDNDFTFYYRNFDLGSEHSWDYQTDIRKTHGLFQSSKYIDLVWNEYLLSDGDSLKWNIIRQFSLQITFSDNDIVNVYGRANLKLTRDTTTKEWKILEWLDESNF